MSPAEIIFVILGISLLLASCFITGGKKEAEEEKKLLDVPVELSPEQQKNIEEKIDLLLEERTENLVVKTDDYLSKISNEKIMAVNDFSTQIIEKIDANHKEVVFIYDMLNQKEEEIKETMQTLEVEKQTLKKNVEEVVKLTKQLNTMMKRMETKSGASPERAVEEIKEKKTAAKQTAKTKAKAEPKKQAVPESKFRAPEEEQVQLPGMMQIDNKNDEILKLHKEGLSVLEISKTLGLGQGEVKLVIGLYGV